MTVARFLWQNFAQLSRAVITASSEELAFPQEWMLDGLRSKRWRSKSGWVIFEGINDKLDFNETPSGAHVATITPGTYTLGGDLATEIQTQMNAVAVDNTYTVVYSVVTFKFNISATGLFSMATLTGPNKPTSVMQDMGYDVTVDHVGATDYFSDTVTYQSRHYVQVSLATPLEIKAAMLLDTNIGAGATVIVQFNTVATWITPAGFKTLVEGDDIWTVNFNAETFQFWRFVINDTQNPNAFTEVGVAYIGSYTQPERGYHLAYTEDRDELSNIESSDQGAHFQNVRQTMRVWSLSWPGLSNLDKIEFEKIIVHVKVGRSFFFALDVTNDPTKVVYVKLERSVGFTSAENFQWRTSFDIVESLG